VCVFTKLVFYISYQLGWASLVQIKEIDPVSNLQKEKNFLADQRIKKKTTQTLEK
jgi:hypothetical protein